jgi:hypothetical protein
MKKNVKVCSIAALVIGGVFLLRSISFASGWFPLPEAGTQPSTVADGLAIDVEAVKANKRMAIWLDSQMTPEARIELEQAKKAQEEADLLKKQAAARVEFDGLEAKLAVFKDTHDMDNLSEDEYIEFVTMQDKALDLSFILADPLTLEEQLEITISTLEVGSSENIYYNSERLRTVSSEWEIEIYEREIARAQKLSELSVEARKRQLRGDDPKALLQYLDEQIDKIAAAYG